eukprot:2230301-Alexandrium_andersonii.AAC.1
MGTCCSQPQTELMDAELSEGKLRCSLSARSMKTGVFAAVPELSSSPPPDRTVFHGGVTAPPRNNPDQLGRRRTQGEVAFLVESRGVGGGSRPACVQENPRKHEQCCVHTRWTSSGS